MTAIRHSNRENRNNGTLPVLGKVLLAGVGLYILVLLILTAVGGLEGQAVAYSLAPNAILLITAAWLLRGRWQVAFELLPGCLLWQLLAFFVTSGDNWFVPLTFVFGAFFAVMTAFAPWKKGVSALKAALNTVIPPCIFLLQMPLARLSADWFGIERFIAFQLKFIRRIGEESWFMMTVWGPILGVVLLAVIFFIHRELNRLDGHGGRG